MKFLTERRDMIERKQADPNFEIDPKKLPAAPFEFQVYTWRKRMRVSYNDMLETPFEVIIHDLEMMGLESQFEPRPQQQT